MVRRLLSGNLLTIAIACCLTATAQTATVKQQVLPLLTTAWGQDAPYNLLCPTKTNANGQPQHCRVGCVACAMGQVMRYYRYPEVGIGTGTNLFNASLTADFGNTYYAWADMAERYTAGSYSDAEAEAVATLLYHCGVALNMIYGVESSSTFTAFANNMTTALVRYFGYDDTTLRSVSRSKYSRDEWLQLIREELSAGRPIIYTGTSPTMGGHTWVVDGYDAEGRIHMNWGWTGRSDGYYDIDLTNVRGLDFSQKQSMVIGIRPPLASRITPCFSLNVEGGMLNENTSSAETNLTPHSTFNTPRNTPRIFTLGGLPVTQPLRPGVYLIEGKKRIIK